MTFHEQVYKVLSEITEMLIDKNDKYGNSALEPLGVFSQLSQKKDYWLELMTSSRESRMVL